jgi:menaquinone-dependent protoporphyrinogen IX oxidase
LVNKEHKTILKTSKSAVYVVKLLIRSSDGDAGYIDEVGESSLC